MKFKVGDKVIMNDEVLIRSGLGQIKIRKGIVTKILSTNLIRVKRGKYNTSWHIDFWRKVK